MLGDVSAYPNFESSGSSFFTYGIASGICNGLLDQTTYEPTLFKAWNALSGAINEEGMLRHVQLTENNAEIYSTGALLAAGSQLYKYIREFYPETIKKDCYTDSVYMHGGGWCWFQSPRAIISGDKLLIGGLDGRDGSVRASVYDLKEDKIEGEVILCENFEFDDHDAPAFYIRKDGSILAMWAKHWKEHTHRYRISEIDNYLEWGETKFTVREVDHNSGVSYMNLYYVEDQGLLYNFFRDGKTYNPTFMTSADEGESWSAKTHLIINEVDGRNRPYAIYQQTDKNTIGISYTDAHPRNYGNSLYYIEFRDGKFYSEDGSFVADLKDGPLPTTKGDKLYTGSETKVKPAGSDSVPNSSWNCTISQDADKNPYIGYTVHFSNSDHRFRVSNWDGAKWIDREIAYAGNALYAKESSYTGLMAFDPTDPTNVYISTDVNPSTGADLGGVHEIYYAKIGPNDDITTIEWSAITKESIYGNIRPIVVSSDDHTVLLWLHGIWTTFNNYDLNVLGLRVR